jgi:hypothetical protein
LPCGGKRSKSFGQVADLRPEREFRPRRSPAAFWLLPSSSFGSASDRSVFPHQNVRRRPNGVRVRCCPRSALAQSDKHLSRANLTHYVDEHDPPATENHCH